MSTRCQKDIPTCQKTFTLTDRRADVAPYLPGVGRDGSRAVVVVVSVQEEGILRKGLV